MRYVCVVILGSCSLYWSSSTIAQERDVTARPTQDDLDVLKSGIIDLTPGYYISPVVSGAYLNGSAEINTVDIDFQGYFTRFGLGFGYQNEHIRVALEPTIGFSEIRLEDDLGGLIDNEDSIKFATFSANAYFDIPLNLTDFISNQGPETKPYIGAGLGAIYADFDNIGDDIGVINQVMTGLGIRLTPYTFVDAEYRLAYLPRLEPGAVNIESLFHTFEVKLRYRF